MPSCFSSLLTWSARRWVVAVLTAGGTFLAIALVTALIENPVFGRTVPPTPWAMQAAVITALLSGLLAATYVRDESFIDEERSLKVGGVGGLATYFAVGCPACNKLVVLALGTTGAIQWFAPIQPYLAGGGILLLAYAVRRRLTAESSCALPTRRMEKP